VSGSAPRPRLLIIEANETRLLIIEANETGVTIKGA
jgi:hypothetical protein